MNKLLVFACVLIAPYHAQAQNDSIILASDLASNTPTERAAKSEASVIEKTKAVEGFVLASEQDLPSPLSVAQDPNAGRSGGNIELMSGRPPLASDYPADIQH